MLSMSSKDVATSIDQNESYLTYFPAKGCYLFVLFLLVVKGGNDQLWLSNRRADMYFEQHPLLICAFPLSCRVIYNYTVSLVSQRALLGRESTFCTLCITICVGGCLHGTHQINTPSPTKSSYS